MKTTRHTSGTLRAILALGLCAAAVAAGGCRGERTNNPPRQILPDMDDSPKHKPQSEAAFFADGRSMRPSVPGTVAFGRSTDAQDASRGWHVKDDPALFEGIDVSVDPAENNNEPGYVKMIPASAMSLVIAEQKDRGVELDAAGAFDWMVERGRQRFNIYCSACHGYNGEGGGATADGQGYGGLVGRRWSYSVPSFHDAKYSDRSVKTGQDGYLFHTIRHGVPNTDGKPPKMPAYHDKVNHRDAWAIVAYLRVLQAARAGSTTASIADEPAPQTADPTSHAASPEVIQ